MFLAKKFVYDKGWVFIDGWRVNHSGGDCNDFAITVAHELAGSWTTLWWKIITLQCVFWMVKSPQNGIIPRHTVLWYRGEGWIDSTHRHFRASPAPHKRRWPIVFPWVVLMVTIGWVWASIFDRDNAA
jgi:hypothetical protein